MAPANFLVMFVIITGQVPNDGASFVAYLKDQFAPIECVEFNFESSVTSAGKLKPFDSFQGSYKYVRNLGEHAEYVVSPDNRDSYRIRISAIGQIERRGEKLFENKPFEWLIGSANVGTSLTTPCLPGRILRIEALRGAEDGIGTSFTNHGIETVSGFPCTKISFTSRGIEYVYWIDSVRGGHAIQWEQHRRGKTYVRASDIALNQLKDSEGHQIWLPIYGRVTGFITREGNANPTVSEEPTGSEEIRIIVPTVRLNHGLAKADLAVSFQNGDIINNKIEGRAYRYGEGGSQRLTNLTKGEATDLLEAGINGAETQVQGLSASRRSKWAPTILALFIGTASIAIIFFALRLRRKLS